MRVYSRLFVGSHFIMTDAYPTRVRQEALQVLQASYPAQFPVAHVAALELFAVQPGDAMERDGVQAYTDYLEDAVEHKVLHEYWSSATGLNGTVALGEQLVYSDGSVNAIRLHALTLNDARLIALTDGSARAVLKSQELRVTDREQPKTLNNALFEFTTEVIVARLLNLLVTAYPHTVTPHFTTFLGCFKANKRAHAAYERADISLQRRMEHEFRAGTACPRRLGARIFAIVFSLAAAAHAFGFSHNDLGLRNIMERAVEPGMAYASAHWAYKLRDVPRYVIVPPEAHGNQMVEIIDFGRASLTAVAPDAPTSSIALRFAYDVGEMLTDVVDLYNENAPRARRGDPLSALIIAIAARLVTWPKRGGARTGAPLALAREIYTKWHTNDPVAGLGFLFESFFHVPAPDGVLPVIVGIAPSDNVLACVDNDPFVTELARIWRVEAAGRRPYSPKRCRTCASVAANVTENGKHGFCDVDCYHVFYAAKRKRDEAEEEEGQRTSKRKRMDTTQ